MHQVGRLSEKRTLSHASCLQDHSAACICLSLRLAGADGPGAPTAVSSAIVWGEDLSVDGDERISTRHNNCHGFCQYDGIFPAPQVPEMGFCHLVGLVISPSPMGGPARGKLTRKGWDATVLARSESE